MAYKDKSYCSRSYSVHLNGCQENCFKLLTVDMKTEALRAGEEIRLKDFKGTSYCIITLEEDDGK